MVVRIALDQKKGNVHEGKAQPIVGATFCCNEVSDIGRNSLFREAAFDDGGG